MIETDGLLIKQISKQDGGTFTCRARVPQTGELEERNIILDVSMMFLIWIVSNDWFVRYKNHQDGS